MWSISPARTQSYAAGTAADTWYDICGVFDGENVILYVNGASQDDNAYPGYLDDTGNKVAIGALSDGALKLTGKVKEVAIWSAARTPTEIALLSEYGYGWLPVDDFLLGWWDFVAQDGTDSSAGGNTMVANGAVTYAATFFALLSGQTVGDLALKLSAYKNTAGDTITINDRYLYAICLPDGT